VAYVFYLGITSIAALLPTYTGLILTIEGVILMGIIMQVLSRHKELKIGDFVGLSEKKLQPQPDDLNTHQSVDEPDFSLQQSQS
jgi:predicted tellurium resistance membrane protein TerC